MTISNRKTSYRSLKQTVDSTSCLWTTILVFDINFQKSVLKSLYALMTGGHKRSAVMGNRDKGSPQTAKLCIDEVQFHIVRKIGKQILCRGCNTVISLNIGTPKIINFPFVPK